MQSLDTNQNFMFLEDVVDRICEIHFHTIKNKKVECKKAQPKETVTPATQLQLQKRLLLSGLGLRMPTGMVANPGGGGVNLQAPLSAYNPMAQVSITRNKKFNHRLLFKRFTAFRLKQMLQLAWFRIKWQQPIRVHLPLQEENCLLHIRHRSTI
jgi:hypothetical protein